MNQPIPITAVILAAGRSTRMGQLKPLLPIQGSPMLEVVIKQVLQFPFHQVIAIIGHEQERIKATISIQDERFQWVVNHDYAHGQSTSLKEAKRHCPPDIKGMLVFLGDQPCIQPTTISQLLSLCLAEQSDHHYIIQPRYKQKPGHPVFISQGMFAFFDKLAGDEGAKRIFPFADKHTFLPVEDDGVVLDLDTPQDYEAYKSKALLDQ